MLILLISIHKMRHHLVEKIASCGWAWAHLVPSLAKPSLKHQLWAIGEFILWWLPSPQQSLFHQLVLQPVTLNPLVAQAVKKRGTGEREKEKKSSREGQCMRQEGQRFGVVFCMLWYAGEWGLPGGLGWEPDGAEHHEDGSVPVHHRWWCPAAAGAGGAAAQPVGGTLFQG